MPSIGLPHQPIWIQNMEIRLAHESDIKDIVLLDQVAHSNDARRDFIARSIHSGATWVAVIDETVVGYAVLDYSFYDYGFISMLYVHSQYRKQGIGLALVQRLELTCMTNKLFTSTNESNHPMHSLLARLQYAPSGIINNLDKDDPEIIYFKQIRDGMPDKTSS